MIEIDVKVQEVREYGIVVVTDDAGDQLEVPVTNQAGNLRHRLKVGDVVAMEFRSNGAGLYWWHISRKVA